MLIELLELASNNALQYDATAMQRLEKLQGKTMLLEIRPIELKPFDKLGVQKLLVSPQPHGLEFCDDIEQTADVTLSATVGALIKIGRDGMNDAELKPGELEISGDPIVGQRFARVLAELDVDWEGFLAEHIGETPAVLISSGLNQAKEFVTESQSSIKDRFSRWLKDDLKLLADKSEVEPFLDEVDTIRADVDRLSARLTRLQTHHR